MLETKKFNDVVTEYEVDSSWRNNLSSEYLAYRRRFEQLLAEKPLDVGSFPSCIEIEATYHCNLDCPFCARSSGMGYRKIKHMSKNTWNSILVEIRENYLPSIMMDHEGESLLNPEIENMISDVRDAGVFDIWLHTNGQALTPKRARNIIEAGITKLNVSIDAATSDTYAIVRPGGAGLKKVTDNLRSFLDIRKKLNRNDIRVRVSFVYYEDNAHERREFFEEWKDEVNVITFQNMVDMSPFESVEKRRSFVRESIETGLDISNFECDMLWTIPIIDSEGNFIPCGMPVRDHTRDEFVIGNITQGDTIASCWTSEKLRNIRIIHQNGDFSKCGMCEGCAYSQKKAINRTATLLQERGKVF